MTSDIAADGPAFYGADARQDRIYRTVRYWFRKVDWVVSNPPYEMPTCTQIVKQAIEHARVGVAMMLRLSFREPTDTRNPRGPFLEANPPSRVLTLPRYSFTGNGKSDSATTEWVIWLKRPLLPHEAPILSLYKADERYAEPGSWRPREAAVGA